MTKRKASTQAKKSRRPGNVSVSNRRLSSLYFGKDDAETDIQVGGLLKEGFLRTAAYEAVIAGKKRLIIGRKGSGKSAICLFIRNTLANEDGVSLITPDDISAEEIRRFELPGITREQSKAVIWRYAFNIQICKHLLTKAKVLFKSESRYPAEMAALRQFLVDNGEVADLTLHEKFWKMLERIKASIKLEALGIGLSGDIAAPSPGIRISTQLEALERCIKKACRLVTAKGDKPLLLLVDQLEKVWSNDTDSDLMVIGLLLASKQVSQTFSHVICTVFLRTDIYELLQFSDRDKFRGDEMHIDWKPEFLSDLVFARARASVDTEAQPRQIWDAFFPAQVTNLPSIDFVIQRTLMRPRDIIQLCNACRDIAEKNGHSAITEGDIHEAVAQYSNWKLSDLINEYLINFPFLNDLFVLFSNANYLVTRGQFEKKLLTIQTAMVSRYQKFGNVFTANGILPILYNIGFLGVIRKNETVFVYNDKNTIEPAERRFVIHPGFRDALRSTSSVDLAPYKPAATSNFVSDIFSLEYGPFRSRSIQTRGRRGFREVEFVMKTCEEVRSSVAKAKLPAEVRGEVLGNLQTILNDVKAVDDHNPLAGLGISQRVADFFVQLRDRLRENDYFAENSDLDYALEAAVREVTRGFAYGEYYK